MVDEKFAEQCEEKTTYVFKIGYKGTKENKEVHQKFSAFAKAECDDGYLMAIKKLIENYEDDWKFNVLANEIGSVREELAAVVEPIEEKLAVPVEREGPKTFGAE